MAKKQYIGVDGIARNTKKLYVGVNKIARKGEKAYIGVNGVARLFFSSSNLQFVGFSDTKGYGTTVVSKDGNSLYLSASGTGPSAIDAGYNLTDANGSLYKIPAGTTITFTMRYEKLASYNLTGLRLADMSGNVTFPYRNVNVTNETFTVMEDSYLMFLAEVGFNGSESEYARLWIDRFELNGLKVI